MRIACVGGGPGGLYFSVLAKRADPTHDVTVYERNRPEDTFGFGVAFSDSTMGFLTAQDQHTYPEILAHSKRWDPFTVIHGGRVLRCGGVGFSAIERRTLLAVLQEQAREAGVNLVFEHEVPEPADLLEADLVVGSDGVNSTVRRAFEEHFRPCLELGPTWFTWLGTDRSFDSLTFCFEGDRSGQYGSHIYPYRDDAATFIVETDAETYHRAGLGSFTEADTIEHCQRLFAPHLDGHQLLSNRSVWARFRTVSCRTWRHRNVVLIGDAAHTAHFSVGSGTKMAMEDALALAQALSRHPADVDSALREFEEERHPRVRHIQRLAATSFDWWASFRHHTRFPPEKFSFHFLTRSQFRYDTLAGRDPAYLAAVEAASGLDVTGRVIGTEPAGGSLPELELLATRHPLALTRPLPVSEAGRVSVDDGVLEDYAGLAGRLPVGVRLFHAGPRGACRARSTGLDRPLPPGLGWGLLSASALAYSPSGVVPRAASETDLDEVCGQFAAAAARAAELGFRFLQLEFGHGYLLGSFISPLTNRRSDAFGGDLAGRLRFPLRVLEAVRGAWLGELAVALSAADWQPAGLAEAELLETARRLHAGGAAWITVLGGQTTWASAPTYGRCFQMLDAGRVQNLAGIPVIAGGGISDLDDVRTLVLSGRAERCLLDSVRCA